MKTPVRSIASTLTAAFIALSVAPAARALTPGDLAGTYVGTSTATLPSGEQITAQLRVRLKRNGTEKVTATVNGQTNTTQGNFRVVSDDAIIEEFGDSEALAFVQINGGQYTFTVLAKEANGEFVSEVTILSKQ